MTQYANYIWNYFINKIGNPYGVAGLMGNLKAESGFCPFRLQGDFTTGYATSIEYTAQVDNGTISKNDFIHNAPNGGGYGLCQWTWWERKQGLYEMWKDGGYSSIGSIELACDWLWHELNHSYPSVLSVLKSATSIRQASDKVLHDFESPADQSTVVEELRESYGQAVYETYAIASVNEAKIKSAVEWALEVANDDSHGYDQNDRWSPDYDCSSFVISAYQQAGAPVKDNGASYTGDMVTAFDNTGFDVLDYSFPLVYGDVLWRDGHTEIYIGNGQTVGAKINENGEVVGGQTGDQTGKEICVSANSGNWTKILRLPSSLGDVPTEPEIPEGGARKRNKMKFLLMYLATRR